MIDKMDDEISTPAQKPAQRLCNEIQLFELCDLESCSCKAGRFCTNSDLLERFEDIAEADMRNPEHYRDVEGDVGEDGDEVGFDDAFDEYGYDADEDEWEE
jgi:hypothetical protein